MKPLLICLLAACLIGCDDSPDMAKQFPDNTARRLRDSEDREYVVIHASGGMYEVKPLK